VSSSEQHYMKTTNLSLSRLYRHTCEVEVQLHSFLTSALDESKWSTSSPGRLNPMNETQYPLDRRLGWTRSRSGRFEEQENLLTLQEFEPRTIQSVA
jgi:hypothetical protein